MPCTSSRRISILVVVAIAGAFAIGAVAREAGSSVAMSVSDDGATGQRAMWVKGSYDPHYFTVSAQFEAADAVVIGDVVAEIPTRMNPRTGGWVDNDTEVLAIPYRGYEIAVKEWYGSLVPSRVIRVYHLGGGEVVVGGERLTAMVEYDPQIRSGDRLLVPITQDNPYGVPTGPNEYWMVSDGKGAFILTSEQAQRAVALEGSVPGSIGIRDIGILQELVGAAFTADLPRRSI